MCGHIIHEEESKLVRLGVTKYKASSQNIKGGLHKDLHKSYTRIYTSIYTRRYIIIYITFEVLRLKISNEGTLVKMRIKKPSVTSTKELQNHQRGSINKCHPLKHQGINMDQDQQTSSKVLGMFPFPLTLWIQTSHTLLVVPNVPVVFIN